MNWSMFVVLPLGGALLCAALVVVVSRTRRHQRERGVQLLQVLRMMVKHVQIHRGLHAAELAGQSDVRDSIHFHVESVRRDIASASAIEASIADNSDWEGITQHWARLSAKGATLNVYDNFEQHCKLVSSCLALMLRLALHFHVERPSRRAETPFWYDLLCLGEALGQLRALGVVILTTSGDRTLKEKCRRRIERVLSDVDAIYHHRQLRERIGKLECEELDTFLAMVEHYIVAAKSWITCEQYFSRATETIEIVYKNFDEEMLGLLRG